MKIKCLIAISCLLIITGRAQVGQGDTIPGHKPLPGKPHLINAPRKIRFDSSVVEVRAFSRDAVNSYSSDRDFQYEHVAEPPRSLWDKLWSWFWFKVNELLSTEAGKNTVWTVGTIVAVAILAFFIFKVTGMNKTSLFSHGKALTFSSSLEDIHEIPFDEAIEKAISEGNFRVAVRLLYLKALKKLSDKSVIDWQKNKTNTHYLHETLNQSWHQQFRSLTYSFEYAWYGEAPVDKAHFSTLHHQFNDLHNQIDT